jgi:hypothetical protein
MRVFLGGWGTLGMDRVIVLGDAHHLITKDKNSKRFMACCNSHTGVLYIITRPKKFVISSG